MAKNKIGMQFSGFAQLAEQLDKLGGSLNSVTEEALIKSKAIVTENLKKATVKENFPAKGKYSRGTTAASIREDNTIVWNGTTAEIEVGFDLTKSGLTSVYLMYGTPRMKKVQAMYDAIYGAKTKAKIKAVQKETFQAAIQKQMG